MLNRLFYIVCFAFLISLSVTNCASKKKLAKQKQDTQDPFIDTLSYYKSLRLSYLLETPVSYLVSNKLYNTIGDWLNLPYQPSTDFGIEDGKLVKTIYEKVYEQKIPGNYNDLVYSKAFSLFTGKNYLEEGDLVYFEYPQVNKPGESSELEQVVGIYLVNDRFLINCKHTAKVSIERLDDDFWSTYFKFAGRYKTTIKPN